MDNQPTPDTIPSEIPQEEQPKHKVPPHHRTHIRFLAIVVFLVLCALLAGMFYNSAQKSLKEADPSKEATLAFTADWLSYTSPSKEISFKYPPGYTVLQDGVVTTIKYPERSNGMVDNQSEIFIERELGNIYNRPVDTYLHLPAEGYEKTTVGGLPGVFVKNPYGGESELIHAYSGDTIYQIRYYGIAGASKTNTDVYRTLLTTLKFNPPQDNSPVKVKDGDIYVSKNGVATKITEWGYNYSPVLSPDGTKIAYLSLTKESIENEKNKVPYAPTSENVWIVNTDGSNPIQLTYHIDYVQRKNLYWLDKDRLLFSDGEATAKMYTLSTKSTQILLGPSTPVTVCLDACGYVDYLFYTDDHSYMVYSYLSEPTRVDILDLKTLKKSTISNLPTNMSFDSKADNNRTLHFVYLDSAQKVHHVTINLATKEVTKD